MPSVQGDFNAARRGQKKSMQHRSLRCSQVLLPANFWQTLPNSPSSVFRKVAHQPAAPCVVQPQGRGLSGLKRQSACSHVVVSLCKATSESGGAVAQSASDSSWDRLTQKLVSAATVVFFFLLVPQIIKNAINLANGDVGALVAVAWVGYLTALLGNVMLLSYFLERRESGGALVQAVGAVTNIVVLSQTYFAGCMPASVYVPTAALVIAATAVSSLKKGGALADDFGRRSWSWWNDFLGLVGVSSLAQAGASTFAGIQSKLPGVIGLGFASTLLLMDRMKTFPQGWRGLWRGIPAWSATLLFAFQPVAQLVKNFSVPDSLGGLSQTTVLLAMVGNGLMVPRALYTRDPVWLAGSAWASFTGWLQLLSLFVNRNPKGIRYLGLLGFGTASLLYVSYNSLVLRKDMQAKKLPVSAASVPRLLKS